LGSSRLMDDWLRIVSKRAEQAMLLIARGCGVRRL